jgi:hypothetical protein
VPYILIIQLLEMLYKGERTKKRTKYITIHTKFIHKKVQFIHSSHKTYF